MDSGQAWLLVALGVCMLTTIWGTLFTFTVYASRLSAAFGLSGLPYWGLQTYLGLRERLAATEGAHSFVYESTRDRTPLGHAHREHIRDLSIDQVRAMYRQAITRLLNEVAETEQFFRAGIVAIDITEAHPFTGDRTGYEDEIIGTKEKTDEYASQWATVQLVGNAVPIVLDAPPSERGRHGWKSSRTCSIRLRTSFTSITC